MNPPDKIDRGFFVGYFTKVPPAIRNMSLAAGVFLVAAFATLALAAALSTDSPGEGGYTNQPGGGKFLTGILETVPYPVLRIAATADQPARALMLSGQGKDGVQGAAEALSGKLVDAGGVIVRRGDLDMLLVGGQIGLRLAEAPATAPTPATPIPLGRWRLTGEICDGKCYAGAMKPGSGLSHKACADLCISGGLPPVFVSTAPVDGSVFFLIAGADGREIATKIPEISAIPLEVEGEIERRDNLLILRLDLASVRAL